MAGMGLKLEVSRYHDHNCFMEAFADLLERLLLTPSRNAKLALLRNYFAQQPDPERGWALAALTGALDFPNIKASLIRKLAQTHIDPVLFQLSYSYVGDLAETVSLIWPDLVNSNSEPTLSEIVSILSSASRAEGEGWIELWLSALNNRGRWALLKLVTGGLRIGVSARLTKRALADFGDVPITEIEEIWHGLDAPYLSLFAWLEGREDKPTSDILAPFRPVMLAHPLVTRKQRDAPETLNPESITAADFAAEWKYDGIRVQAVSDQGARRLYTRTGDDISHTFPDVLDHLNFEAALDGELLIRAANGATAPFNQLQQRLNRKTVTPKQIQDRPAFIRVYDILQLDGVDLRGRPFVERRAILERFMTQTPQSGLDLSPLVEVTNYTALDALRNAPPMPDIEGLMLKRWDSVYEAGRPKGPWFKWKRDPFLIDAVMLYAQRGHGKRSGYYSDFTFGVWQTKGDTPQLTPVGKAYFGFTDAELKRLDKFVRAHTVERYGPVCAVEASEDAGLVLEIAFEGLQRSSRHKSGLAMRFPRIHRIRWDKPAAEADTLETLAALLPEDVDVAHD